MTDLPVWLQEIRDRAEAATPGPWRVVAHGEQDCLARREITAGKHIMIARVDCVPGVAADFDRDYAFIAHARTDVPRLIDAVAEITDALEAAITEVQRRCPRLCDYGGKYMPSGISDNDVCAKCRTAECRIPDVISVYRKYRGEVGMNDETIQG